MEKPLQTAITVHADKLSMAKYFPTSTIFFTLEHCFSLFASRSTPHPTTKCTHTHTHTHIHTQVHAHTHAEYIYIQQYFALKRQPAHSQQQKWLSDPILENNE